MLSKGVLFAPGVRGVSGFFKSQMNISESLAPKFEIDKDSYSPVSKQLQHSGNFLIQNCFFSARLDLIQVFVFPLFALCCVRYSELKTETCSKSSARQIEDKLQILMHRINILHKEEKLH